MKAIPVPPANFTDLLLDAVCVVDRDGYFLYVSAASEQIFGYKPDEMIGKPMIEFVYPEIVREHSMPSLRFLMAKKNRILKIAMCVKTAK